MRFKGLVITVSAFALYLLTLSRHYTGASIEFITEIEWGDWPTMLQRHKLLVHPAGWAFYQLWRWLGWHDQAVFPLQVFNALFGAVSVGLMFALARQLTRSTKTGLLVTIGFAFSCAIWLYSTEAEFVTLPLAEALIMFWLLMNVSPTISTRPAYAVVLGLWAALAFLTFSSNIFLIPVVLANYWLMENQTWQDRLKRIAIFLSVMALTVLPVYAYVFYFVNGIRDITLLRTMQVYGGQGTGTLYGHFELKNVFYGGYALLRTLSGYPNLGLDGRTSLFLGSTTALQKAAFVGYYAFVMAAFAAPLLIALLKRRQILQFGGPTLGILATWALLCSGFAVYWVPKDLKFWFPVLAPWWLLVGMVVTLLNAERSNTKVQPAWWYKISPNWVVASIIAVFALLNGIGIVFPHLSLKTNRPYWIARSVTDHTTLQDLVITTGGDKLAEYVPYFGNRETICVLDRLLRSYASKEQILAELDREVSRVQARGGRTYLVGVRPGQDAAWDDLQKVDLRREDFAHFTTRLAWSVEDEDILQILPPSMSH